jgi:hypothetical protein
VNRGATLALAAAATRRHGHEKLSDMLSGAYVAWQHGRAFYGAPRRLARPCLTPQHAGSLLAVTIKPARYGRFGTEGVVDACLRKYAARRAIDGFAKVTLEDRVTHWIKRHRASIEAFRKVVIKRMKKGNTNTKGGAPMSAGKAPRKKAPTHPKIGPTAKASGTATKLSQPS